jgi:hypothetical protein
MVKSTAQRTFAHFCPHWSLSIAETPVFDLHDTGRQVGVRTEKTCRLCHTKFVTALH